MADPADPSTWPAERLKAAKRTVTLAAELLFLSASEFAQVSAMTGLPVEMIDDALVLARAMSEDRQLRALPAMRGGVA